FELRVSGDSRAVEAQVQLLAYGGGGGVSRQSTRADGYTLGLSPRGDQLQAMAAASQAEILQQFEVRGPPVPILVELEALRPTTLAEQGGASGGGGAPRYEVEIVELSFPGRKPTGAAWDAFGGAPDMQVTFIQDGQVLRSVTAPRDAYSARFSDAPLGRLISVDENHPLTVRFTDLDVADHDPAGQAVVTSLHDGENLIVSDVGARVLVRAVSR
ncbi:MAG: hypothetical protein KC609_14425, partial [Myxococcales bacterium]|nr:hypothetical protein [Myxococcales bacterium]